MKLLSELRWPANYKLIHNPCQVTVNPSCAATVNWSLLIHRSIMINEIASECSPDYLYASLFHEHMQVYHTVNVIGTSVEHSERVTVQNCCESSETQMINELRLY